MNKNELEEKLTEIIQIPICAFEIKPESKLQEDLGIDSLDAIELVMYIEEEFDIEIEEAQFIKLTTFQDLLDYVWDLINANQ